jgi:hypothetical protein
MLNSEIMSSTADYSDTVAPFFDVIKLIRLMLCEICDRISPVAFASSFSPPLDVMEFIKFQPTMFRVRCNSLRCDGRDVESSLQNMIVAACGAAMEQVSYLGRGWERESEEL